VTDSRFTPPHIRPLVFRLVRRLYVEMDLQFLASIEAGPAHIMAALQNGSEWN